MQLEEYGLLYQVNSWGPLLKLMQADAPEKKAKWQGEQVRSTPLPFSPPSKKAAHKHDSEFRTEGDRGWRERDLGCAPNDRHFCSHIADERGGICRQVSIPDAGLLVRICRAP